MLATLTSPVSSLLLSESVLLLFAPHIHDLPVLVHLHGVIHQSIHVDELDALLLSVKQHGRNDRKLSHLLLCVLTYTHMPHTRHKQKPAYWSECVGLER